MTEAVLIERARLIADEEAARVRRAVFDREMHIAPDGTQADVKPSRNSATIERKRSQPHRSSPRKQTTEELQDVTSLDQARAARDLARRGVR